METATKSLSVSSFDWEKGTWRDSKTSDRTRLKAEGASTEDAHCTLCIAGDWAPIRAFQGIIEENPESIYGDLLPVLRSADLSIVNLEAPLSDVGEAVWKSGAVFKGEKQHVSGLSAVPFDAVTLGNNHMFDFGKDAFYQTLDALNGQGIQYAGAGENLEEAAAPLILTANGLKIAVVNFSEGEDLTAAEEEQPGVMGWDLDCMERSIQALAARKQTGEIDFILTVAHCGIEYIPFPPPYVAKAFERMVDAGADAVIGHHPHVPQGVQFYKNVPIFYSLGNFVFYQPTDLKYRKLGYVVNLSVAKKTASKESPGDNSLVSFEVVPYEITDHGVCLLKGEKRDHFFSKFKAISLPLNTPLTLDETWHAFLHYYGTDGFLNEIAMISDRIKEEPRKGAAMFRNRLTTLQHYHHWKDLLNRMVQGNLEDSPKWARDIVDEWLTTPLDASAK